MGVFKSMRDLQKQAKEIEKTMPPVGDRMRTGAGADGERQPDDGGADPGSERGRGRRRGPGRTAPRCAGP